VLWGGTPSPRNGIFIALVSNVLERGSKHLATVDDSAGRASLRRQLLTNAHSSGPWRALTVRHLDP
jgi:hypothetical protein